MPTSDKHIHQSVPSCTILRNILELISPTHCSTMQIYTHETKNRLPPPPISPLGYAPLATSPPKFCRVWPIHFEI